MSRNASTLNRTMRNKFGSTSTNESSQVPTDQQLQTYTDHYGGKWVGKKRDFINIPIYMYKSLGSVGHIMVSKPTKLSTDTTTIEFTVAEPPWSTLYEERCELEVYCRWHGLRVPKARSVIYRWTCQHTCSSWTKEQSNVKATRPFSCNPKS